MKNILMIFIILFQVACTRMQTLNLKTHYYSERPSNIIWIQIAGFTDQHIPLLRFNNPNSNYHTQFESADCIGKMWSYNLFDLRPTAELSFITQVTGSKNMKGSCDDFSRKPIWSYFDELGYRTSILESGTLASESFEKFLNCGDIQKNYMKSVEFVRMGPAQDPKVNSFHFQDQRGRINGIAYDKSCKNGTCYSTFSNNAKKIMYVLGTTGSLSTQNFYILRDFTYLNAIRKNDLSYAKEVLSDLDRLLQWVESTNRNDVLIVITGAEGLEIDFPKEGKEWSEYVQTGKNLKVKNTTLLSTVIAKGPMSENFCGLFDESDIAERLLYKPKKKRFSWDTINPFNN
jgi:hypothetical protein